MHQIDPDRKLKTLGWWLHGLGIIVAIAIALSAEFILYRPIDDRTAACAGRIEKLQTLFRDEDQLRTEHTRLCKELAIARKQAATLHARIPDEPRESDFLAQASRLAGEVGLQIQDYRPGKATSRQTHSVMQVDLICKGDCASIAHFLDRLSKLPRHSTISRLEIDAESSQADYATKISVTLYFGVNGRPDADKKGTTHA